MFTQDFFDPIINIQWNAATEIKPGGLISQVGVKHPDPTTILIAVAVRISQKSIDACLAASTHSIINPNPPPALIPGIPPFIPIFEFGISADGQVVEHGTIQVGSVEVNMGFSFGDFFGLGTPPGSYGYTCTFSSNITPPGPPVEGLPIALPPASVTMSYPYPPTTITFNPSTPDATCIDFNGTTLGGSIAVGGMSLDGIPLSPVLIAYEHQTDLFATGSTWTYDLGSIPTTSITPTTLFPSVLYLDASNNSINLNIAGRANLNSFDPRSTAFFNSVNNAFLTDKWNHIIISVKLDKDSTQTWGVVINGAVDNSGTFTPPGPINPFNATNMALNKYEIGVPAIPSDLKRHYGAGPNQDLDYIGLQVWFGKKYVEASNPDTIALFVDENKHLVPRSKAEKALGKADVWMDNGAASFIKNKGTIGEFTPKGFISGSRGLIIDYTPYPQFIGKKDTSVPSKQNQFSP